MKLLHKFAQWILKDYTIKLPRYPYIFELEPMKPDVITYINVGNGKLKEAKTDEQYKDLMIKQHCDNYKYHEVYALYVTALGEINKNKGVQAMMQKSIDNLKNKLDL